MSGSFRADDPVTSHLRRDHLQLHEDLTVHEAIKVLRQSPPSRAISYFYVIDAANCLRGVAPTRRLLLSPETSLLKDIMIRAVHTLPATARMTEACEHFVQHRLLALPVVDPDGRLLGVIDMELFRKGLDDETLSAGRDDLFQLVGIHAGEGVAQGPVSAFRQRFPWLGCNIVAGIVAAFLSGSYQHVLSQYVALAFFFPIVLNLGESITTQTLSLSLPFVQGRVLPSREILRRVALEAMTGCLLGLGCGLAIGAVELLWLGEPRVALCLLGGIFGGVVIAALLGIVVPVVLRLFGKQPHVAAGPIALAGSDIVALFFYLFLANWLLIH